MKPEATKYFYEIEVSDFLVVFIRHIKLTKQTSPERYKYKIIDHKVIRDFELPETIEEKLKEKYRHSYGGFTRGRGIDNIIGGEKNFNEEELYENISDELILEKVEEKKQQLKKYENNHLYCPITGGRLIRIGSEMHVMDGSILWISVDATGKELLQWETGTRWYYDIFSSRYGKYKWYEKEKEWRKQVYVADKYHDEPQTQEQKDALKKLAEEYEEKERLRKEEYEKKVASGEIKPLLPLFQQVFAKTLNLDIIKVKPMDFPSGKLYYMDPNPFDFEDEDDKKIQ